MSIAVVSNGVSVESPRLERAARPHLRLVPPMETAPVESGVERVYRRRRFAALCALAVLVIGAIFASRAMASPAGDTAPVTVVVQPGQTLSGIAVRALPGLSASQAVVELQQANNLSSLQVDAGQKLIIPSE